MSFLQKYSICRICLLGIRKIEFIYDPITPSKGFWDGPKAGYGPKVKGNKPRMGKRSFLIELFRIGEAIEKGWRSKRSCCF